MRFQQVDVHLLALPADPGCHVVLFAGGVVVDGLQSEGGVVVGIDEGVWRRRVELFYACLEFLLSAFVDCDGTRRVRIDHRTDSWVLIAWLL